MSKDVSTRSVGKTPRPRDRPGKSRAGHHDHKVATPADTRGDRPAERRLKLVRRPDGDRCLEREVARRLLALTKALELGLDLGA